jgi:hypothetical protein
MRQPRHGHPPGNAGGCRKKSKTGLSPEAWEKIEKFGRLLISSLEPVAKLIDAISRLR